MTLSAQQQQEEAAIFAAAPIYQKFLQETTLSQEEQIDLMTLIYKQARTTGYADGFQDGLQNGLPVK